MGISCIGPENFCEDTKKICIFAGFHELEHYV